MTDSIGFDNNFNLLLNKLKNNQLSHSLLLTGNKGIGKKKFLANIIKKYFKTLINEEQYDHHITLFLNNSHPNIRLVKKEIDEKNKKMKNIITVDQIRKLNQFVFETSIIENLPKFILIDSADDLNINASNALLKLLEEPKNNTYFFLLSHQPSLLLPTIKSRCLKINLNNHTFDNFNHILISSNPNANEDVIKFLFDITNGSPGLTTQYDIEEILNLFEKIIYSISDIDPFSNLNNELINILSTFDNEKLKIYLSLFKFILITLSKIKIGINIRDHYLSKNILKIESLTDHISNQTIQRKLDYLINNENDLFTFNLDKKIFMINFISER